MDRFSPDGKWWWDGANWMATSQIVLPQLPPTEVELSGELAAARGRISKRSALLRGLMQREPLRAYREWTLEQLALATAHLLGPGEPMLAGETTMFSTFFLATVKRDLAVAVTSRRVLVLRIDHLDGQPRWVALAALASDVRMRSASTLGYKPMVLIVHGAAEWVITGDARVFRPQPVLDAWRRAAVTMISA